MPGLRYWKVLGRLGLIVGRVDRKTLVSPRTLGRAIRPWDLALVFLLVFDQILTDTIH